MKPLLFLAVLLISISSFAQKEISIDIGYGPTGPYLSELDLVGLHQSVVLVGVNYTKSLPNPLFRFTGGLNLIGRSRNRYLNSFRVAYLNIPVGLEITGAGKLKFVVGAGPYLNTFLGHNGVNDDFHKFVVGAYAKVGTGYQLTPKYRIMLTVRLNADLSQTANETQGSLSGALSEIDEYYSDKILALSIYYKL